MEEPVEDARESPKDDETVLGSQSGLDDSLLSNRHGSSSEEEGSVRDKGYLDIDGNVITTSALITEWMTSQKISKTLAARIEAILFSKIFTKHNLLAKIKVLVKEGIKLIESNIDEMLMNSIPPNCDEEITKEDFSSIRELNVEVSRLKEENKKLEQEVKFCRKSLLLKKKTSHNLGEEKKEEKDEKLKGEKISSQRYDDLLNLIKNTGYENKDD